jgi:hypothetical protein
MADDLGSAVAGRPGQWDAPAFEKCQGLGVGLVELVALVWDGHGELRLHDLELAGVCPAAGAVAGKIEDREAMDEVHAR